jgi:hypothetical protein
LSAIYVATRKFVSRSFVNPSIAQTI